MLPPRGFRRSLASLGALALLLTGCIDETPTAVDVGGPHPEPVRSVSPALIQSTPWAGGSVLVSPTGLDFGDVQVGTTSGAQAVTVTNVGPEALVMSGTGGAAGVFGGVQDCQGRTLAPGESCSMTYAFTPATAGDVVVNTAGTWNGEPFEIELRGRGVAPRFRITPTSLDFGDVPVGSSLQQTVSVTNVGLAPVVVSMTGGAAGAFGGSQNCQGNTLAPGASCQITYTFSPTAPGVVTATTGGTVNDQAFSFSFRGNGVAPSFRITPTALDFGEVVVGSSLQQRVDVVNTSTVPVVVSMTGGAAGAFGGSQNCQGNTLAPGASCQITYTFSPTAPGVVTATTGGTVNDQAFSFSFRGVGIASETDRSLPFRISPTALDFGDIQVGHSLQQRVDVVNVSGAPVTVSMTGGAAGAFGGSQNCQGNTLAPGASCQITYTFSPTAPGVVTATTGGTVNDQAFSFSFRGVGVPARFRISPTSLDFGTLQVGTSLQQSVTVTNVGTDPAVISMAGGAAGAFGGSQNCQGNTLAPGASCQITYTFSPTAPGVVTATTGGTVNDQAFSFSMRGEGLAPRFRITPFAFDFGPVDVGTSEQRSVSVTNMGLAPVVVSMTGGAAGVFGGSQNCQSNTLAPGVSCQITYTFSPTAPGLVSATTGGTVNDQPYGFTMHGTGRVPGAATYAFLGFTGALSAAPQFRRGTVMPVRFALGYGSGEPLSEAEASAFAAACAARVTFSGDPGASLCADYDPATGQFGANVRLERTLPAGTYQVAARLIQGAAVLAEGTVEVMVR
jgi:hypothetical protein